MGTLPGLGFARREAAELPPRPPRYSAPAEPGTGRSAHTWGGAPVKAGLRPATDVWVGPGTGFARRGELTRSDLPLLSRTSRAVYRPKRPHTWGSGPDRASPGGERERTPLCCSPPQPNSVQAEAPKPAGLWAGHLAWTRLYPTGSGRESSPLRLCTNQAVLGPKRPHTLCSRPDWASPGGERLSALPLAALHRPRGV